MKINPRVLPLFLVCAATGWADETFTGQSTFSNPSGREVAIDNDNGDSTLTFLDTNDASYSMGIDYSDGRKFKIGYGGQLGENDDITMSSSGRMGFGTSNHSPYFHHFRGEAFPIGFGVESDYPAVVQDGTNYWKQMEIGEPVYNLPAGVTDSGYRVSLAVQGYVHTGSFAGTLSNQTAAWIRAGSHSTAPTGRIVNSYALYIDNIASPNVQIDNAYGVYQASSNAKNYFGGYVGIGTSSPGSILTVVRPGYASNPSYNGLAFIHQSSNPDGALLQPALELRNGGGSGFGLVSYAPNNYFSGNIGIGTTTPQNKLDVNGTIRAKEVIVESAWADYVFEKDYALPSLGEVSDHIRRHGRLPGVPSAEEVAESGVSIGESQRILLAKIEELTLYVVQLENDKTTLRSDMEALIQRVKSLEEKR